jgi:hypothetical protein
METTITFLLNVLKHMFHYHNYFKEFKNIKKKFELMEIHKLIIYNEKKKKSTKK